MAGCSSCGKTVDTNTVKVNSTYTPQTNKQTKISDVIMSYTIEKKPNDTQTTDRESTQEH